MYQRHFGLSRQPFSIAPNPRFLYMSPQHREALAILLYGVRTSDGFVQLTGEVGTGKTTICRCLIEQLPQAVDIALILNPRVTALELVGSLCDELKIDYPKTTTSLKVLIDALNAYLLDNHAAGRRTVLIIDEAQCLSTEALEQVRLLTNLETSDAKLLQIILVGQPELRELLARDELRQLAQRITARYHLTPFSRAETASYIRHRLQRAGSDRAVFDDQAIDTVHQLAKGIPRLINVLCDRAMIGAFAEDVRTVDKRIVLKAAAEVLPEAKRDSPPPPPSPPPTRRLGRALVLLLCIGLVVSLWYGADLLDDVSTGRAVPETAGEPPLRQPPSPPSQDAAPVPGPPPVPEGVAREAPLPEPPLSEPIEIDPMPSQPIAPPEVEAEAEAVVAPVVPDEPSPPAPSLAEHLDNADTAASALAWPGLYRLWGYDSAAATDEQACAQAPAAGLACLKGAGSWGLLRRLDRPAVLLLQAGGGRLVAVVLQRVDGDQVLVEIGGEVLRVPWAEVEQRWYGAYRLLWKKPPSGHVMLRPGMRGRDVRWLRERLNRAEGGQVASRDPALYDESLASAVRGLQSDHGLVVDGIAGAHTLIALNNLVADPEIPRLVGFATVASE